MPRFIAKAKPSTAGSQSCKRVTGDVLSKVNRLSGVYSFVTGKVTLNGVVTDGYLGVNPNTLASRLRALGISRNYNG